MHEDLARRISTEGIQDAGKSQKNGLPEEPTHINLSLTINHIAPGVAARLLGRASKEVVNEINTAIECAGVPRVLATQLSPLRPFELVGEPVRKGFVWDAAMGDSTQSSNTSGWTKSDVFALLAVVFALPAMVVPAIALWAAWRRRFRHRRVHSDDGEAGTLDTQNRSISSSIPIAEGSTDMNRTYRGQDVELQDLGTSEYLDGGGARDVLDVSITGLGALTWDRQCRMRSRQSPSLDVNDVSAISMAREDPTPSPKGQEVHGEIGTTDFTLWFREEFERTNAQMTVEKDEWAISRVNRRA
ncbi:hypothetical protein MMC07_004826 [Pseudocyphellaria aurata]|nr:hypothetical protein [Pseudocyphellaria aurata]